MAGEIASAYVSLIPSFRGGASAISSELDAPSKKAGKSAGQKFGGEFAESARHPITKLTGVVAGLFAVDKVKDFAKESITAASDLNETVSKTGQIFGQGALPALQRFAAGAATAMGQSKQQALDAAGTFAIFGKSAGLNGQKLVGFSTKLTTLASDLSSFHNTSPQQAIEAIGAALRGESEPIRAYGVLLNDAALKAEALRLGLLKPVKDQSKIATAQARLIVAQSNYNATVKKSGKDSIAAIKAQASLGSAQSTLAKATQGTLPALTAQQKVLASQSLIMKQTKDAQGDFARTSGGLANQQRILGAEVENLKAKLGTGLLPITKKVVSEAAKFVTGMQDGTGAGGQLADVLGDIVKSGRPVVKLLGGVAKLFGDIPGPMKSIVIEGGLLALIWPKITAGAASMSTAVTTRLAAVKAEMAALRTEGVLTTQGAVKFGQAVKAAAGIGGVLALTQATRETNQNLATLEKTAGGAALGLAVAGPWGAAVGGAVGLISGLSTKMHTANAETRNFAGVLRQTDAIRNYTKDSNDLRDSLNQVTGAFSRSTNAGIRDKLVKSGQLPLLNSMGISTRALILAIKGNKTALDQVSPGFDKLGNRIAAAQTKVARLRAIVAAVQAKGANTAAGDQVLKNLGFEGTFSDLTKQFQAAIAAKNKLVAAKAVLPGFTRDLKNNQAAIRQSTEDTRDYTRVLKAAGFGKTLIGKIQVEGIKQSARGVASVVRQFKLAHNSSTITALIKASGWQVTGKHVQSVLDLLNKVGTTSPKKATETGKKTGGGLLAGVLGTLLGPGPTKTTNSLNSLLSGATTTTSRTVAVGGGRRVAKVVTSTLAAEIRNGKPQVIGALDYLIQQALLGVTVPTPTGVHPQAQRTPRQATLTPRRAAPGLGVNGRVTTGTPVIQIGQVYAQDVNTFVKAERNRQRRLALGGIGG